MNSRRNGKGSGPLTQALICARKISDIVAVSMPLPAPFPLNSRKRGLAARQCKTALAKNIATVARRHSAHIATGKESSEMDLDLKSRTAVVTGASIGIGRAIAKGLALEGVRVVAVARRKALLDTLAQEVQAAGGAAVIPVAQDIMQEDAAKQLAAAAIAEVGHIDILVNNAGGSRPLPVDAPDSDWDEAIALNFTSYRKLAHALLPQMMERRWGRIINITGKSEPEGLNAAFAAKAAVHAWAKGLSREIGQHGITVNCIPPGRIMSEQIRRNYPEDYRKHFAEEEIPVGYWGEPEDLAALVVFLASPIARYITGTVIPVDGGLRRYQF
jgi:3-oxoacyl-[acyl-carrier protein] reductase